MYTIVCLLIKNAVICKFMCAVQTFPSIKKVDLNQGSQVTQTLHPDSAALQEETIQE